MRLSASALSASHLVIVKGPGESPGLSLSSYRYEFSGSILLVWVSTETHRAKASSAYLLLQGLTGTSPRSLRRRGPSMKNSHSTTRRVYALVCAATLISALSLGITPSAVGQTSLSQCNGTDNVGGQAVECHYAVTNNLDGNTTSSSTTVTECHGAANDPATLVCTPTTTTSTQLVTTVDQCNGSGNGGGGTVVCTVDVTNNITGNTTPTAATVNQCNASGLGGGTAPTVLCNPFPANTTGADVTQCNDSGNGGGGTQRVQCTVDSDSTTTSILDVTVNQCNGSGNGGGATVTCRTGITNNIRAAQVPTPSSPPSARPTTGSSSEPTTAPSNAPSNEPTSAPTAALPVGPGPSNGGPDGGTNTGSGGPDSNAGAGEPDSNGGAGGTGGGLDNGGVERRSDGAITNQVVRIPIGGVGAGSGSTSGFEQRGLLRLGLLLISAAAFGGLLRRRDEVAAAA